MNRACDNDLLNYVGNTWKRELNAQNPLGHKGQIAQVYAELLHQIYDVSSNSCTPRSFKSTLGKFAPQFAGYGQQDSQEFMSFLVDGLHEDLNRILKKPYIENPESDDSTVNDPEAIKQLGQKYREIYNARNNSVITDLFSGSYKNKLVCPECHKVSVNFDPFLLLTLQLPIEHAWEFTFTIVPLTGKPFGLRVDNSKGSSMKDLKEFVTTRVEGTSVGKLLMTEVFSNKLYRVMEDHVSLSEANIQNRDDMIIYELEDEPTNWPPPPKKFRSMLEVDAKEDPTPTKNIDEHQLVMVQHRSASHHSYTYSKNVVLWPTFITIDEKDTQDYDEILRKLLLAVQAQTTQNLDDFVASATKHVESDKSPSESPPEYVDVGMSADESDSTMVKAESVDDDDLVDVKMTNGDETQSDTEASSPTQPLHWSQRGAPIPDVLRNLFDICNVPSSEPIPTGYSSIDWSRSYPSMKDRIPKPMSEPEESEPASSPKSADVSDDETTEDGTEPTNDTAPQMSVIESEGEFSTAKPGSSRNKKNRGKRNKQQKYGKQFRRQTTPKTFPKKGLANNYHSDHDSGNDRLIRSNEIIILDWDYNAYRELFDSPTGGDAKKAAEVREDPVLDEKAKKREMRKKQGLNLAECFEETSKAEILTEDNAWYCPRCKERRLASKQLELWTVPDILVIHLKRFSSGSGRGISRDKLDLLVDFPLEGLDLNGKVGVDEGKDLTYDLFAVDNHYGGLGGGHYTAFAKNFYDGEWYEYNG
jgi:ubiquitin carboxyl-terminal hydrolase 4/11